MTTTSPSPGDLYRSRDGRCFMRVIHVADGRAFCIHVDRRRYPLRFDLPVAYFSWASCGWQLANANDVDMLAARR